MRSNCFGFWQIETSSQLTLPSTKALQVEGFVIFFFSFFFFYFELQKGLAHLYEFCSGGNLLVPAEVAKAGVAEVDAAASQALLLHYRYLMRCAQNLCVTLLLKDGVFFAGDNGVANGPWVRRNFDQLHAEFLNHSKRDWISETPLFAQTKETNFNLLGAIYQAETNFK